MRIVNGVRSFMIELDERQLTAIRAYLGVGQHDQVRPLIEHIQSQITAQQPQPEGGRLATESARECESAS